MARSEPEVYVPTGILLALSIDFKLLLLLALGHEVLLATRNVVPAAGVLGVDKPFSRNYFSTRIHFLNRLRFRTCTSFFSICNTSLFMVLIFCLSANKAQHNDDQQIRLRWLGPSSCFYAGHLEDRCRAYAQVVV